MSLKYQKQKDLIKTFDEIDHLVNLDIPARGVIAQLYRFARNRVNQPLTYLASIKLNEIVKKGDIVFIATGWPDRPDITPQIAETDGPPGAALLARAIKKSFNAIPFVFIEKYLVNAMSMVVNAAGLRVLSPEQAIQACTHHAPINASAVLPFPIDKDEAIKIARDLIKKYKPKAVISIEKGGMNEKEVIHTSRGADTTKYMAKVDYLIRQAKKEGIVTIGIGDGGNEIGMGIIQEDIKKYIPFGDKCKCPCGVGIAPSTKTNFLITAAVSNWGAYGLEAGLALLKGKPGIFHNGTIERRVLEKAADAQFIDGISGYTEPGADGLSAHIHICFVEILKELIAKSIKKLKIEA